MTSNGIRKTGIVNILKLPKIDIKELERAKEQNFRERLEFLDKYAEWVKKTENSKWSSEQKTLMGSRAKKKRCLSK